MRRVEGERTRRRERKKLKQVANTEGEPSHKMARNGDQPAVQQWRRRLPPLPSGVPDCDVCARADRVLRKAIPELRVKSNVPVTLARLTITSHDSPVIAKIVQGQLTLPKLIVFREGEAKDYDGARPPRTPDAAPLPRPIRTSPVATPHLPT